MRRCLLLVLAIFLVWAGLGAEGQTASPAFDLVGPKVDVHVKRERIDPPHRPGAKPAAG